MIFSRPIEQCDATRIRYRRYKRSPTTSTDKFCLIPFSDRSTRFGRPPCAFRRRVPIPHRQQRAPDDGYSFRCGRRALKHPYNERKRATCDVRLRDGGTKYRGDDDTKRSRSIDGKRGKRWPRCSRRITAVVDRRAPAGTPMLLIILRREKINKTETVQTACAVLLTGLRVFEDYFCWGPERRVRSRTE